MFANCGSILSVLKLVIHFFQNSSVWLICFSSDSFLYFSRVSSASFSVAAIVIMTANVFDSLACKLGISQLKQELTSFKPLYNVREPPDSLWSYTSLNESESSPCTPHW